MKKTTYHSALRPEISGLEGCGFASDSDRNIAFCHDITKGIHIAYNTCDIIYSEPSWIDGYQKFLERSESKEESTYLQYLDAINEWINQFECPFALLLGKHALKNICRFDSSITIKLFGYDAGIYGWRIDLSKYQSKTNIEFIEKLANDFQRVGDFCCGYGNTGKIFKERGKNFIMSDINKKCISYIRDNIMI